MSRTKEQEVGKAAREGRGLPGSRFEGKCGAPADRVYDLLADLSSHLEWGGYRQRKTTHLLTMEAPPGPATVGTEFHSTGADGKARFSDRSVVTEATRPGVFEFVTEATRQGKAGTPPMQLTTVHRYEIEPRELGSRVVYTGEVTRLSGAPKILGAPVIGKLLWRMGAGLMKKGFGNLLAVAEERSHH